MILLECTVALRDGDRKKIQEQLAAEIGQPVVLLPNSVSRAKERNILFLCDRKACEKCSYPTCRHTPELELFLHGFMQERKEMEAAQE